jgi:delta-aminolevulinic acid dehydratase/porphobilinogen synthase
MYPIFITDNPDAEEEIPSLPLQKRYFSLRIALTPQVGCE